MKDMTEIIVGILIIVLIIELFRGDYAKIFFPDEYLDSTYEIDFNKLKEEGYKALIFDIDNTLVEHGKPADERAKALMKELHGMGFEVVYLSNNKEGRVKSFRDEALREAHYIYKAGKPKKSGYLKAMEIMSSNIDNTLFVGDQLFTDVWGAKRCGMTNILVKPIDKKEEIQIVLKRRLEYIVLAYFKRTENYARKSHKKI